MGRDARAILFWGIAYTSEDDLPDDPTGLAYEARRADQKAAVPEPDVPGYRGPEWDAWRERRDAWERERCDVGRHGSIDYSCYYVAVNASKVKVDWGDAKEVASLDVGPDWESKLRAYCERLGLPWREPKWQLVAYYG